MQEFFDETLWKSRVTIRAIVIETTTGMSFWASPVCWTLQSLQLLNWAIHQFKLFLKGKWWQFGTIDKPGTSLFQRYTIRSACHTHPPLLVSTIVEFLSSIFKATVTSTFVVHLLWKLKKMIVNVEKLCVQFCGILAGSFEIMPH